MRPTAWLTPVDIPILEWFGLKEIVAPPKVVFENTKRKAGYSHTQVKRRMVRLEQGGLLERYEDARGYYQLSDAGRRWLDGEMTVEELEDLDPR